MSVAVPVSRVTKERRIYHGGTASLASFPARLAVHCKTNMAYDHQLAGDGVEHRHHRPPRGGRVAARQVRTNRRHRNLEWAGGVERTSARALSPVIRLQLPRGLFGVRRQSFVFNGMRYLL